MNNPVWIDDKGKIVEPEYCRDFLSRHPMRCINDRFYTVDGPLPDESKLKRTIYEEISPWLHAKVAQTVEQIIKALKLAAYTDPLPLQCDRIHVANGTYFLDGTFTEKKEYCNNHLSVPYRADAPAPEHWLRFLSELLEPEDIPALQEYLVYCLIPSTKGQKMLMLIGKGGEGKSRIGVVMNAIFGLSMNTTSIQKVENNRFARADLEGKLLMVDDDLDMNALTKTNYVKSIVTAELRMDLERKKEQSYQGQLYVRFLCFGNGALTALHDRSDGFFRRQIILTTKDKPVERFDDPFLAEKLIAEKEGIFLWMLEGLRRLIANHYHFTICSAHYIREDVLRELVLERIRAVNAYIRQDVEGFQEEWLQCRRSDQERNIREDRKRVEQARKRLTDLNVLLSRLYEDFVLGDLNKERYKKMTADYEAEQERLKLEIEVTEEWLETQETMSADVDAFVALTQKYVDVPELTPTIVNEYIKKIEVFAPDKSSGKRVQKVKIYFNFVDDVEIPVISEPVVAKSTPGRRKTA